MLIGQGRWHLSCTQTRYRGLTPGEKTNELGSGAVYYVGIGPSLFFLPMIALGSYTVLSFVPLLGLIRAAKIAENGTDYSVENTARHALFLGTSREVK